VKHLLKFNESNKYLMLKNIIEDIKDICIDLEDLGFNIKIQPDNDIKIKVLSLDGNLYNSLRDVPFYVEISKFSTFRRQFYVDDSSWDVIQRLLEFMKSSGFKNKIELSHPTHASQSVDITSLSDYTSRPTYYIRVSFIKI